MNESVIPVIQFILEKAKFHSEMKYSTERCSFDMAPYESTASGVYFILDGDGILKIGKADGVYGLKGRIASYRSNLSKRKTNGNDHTVNRFYEKMTGELKHKVLKMFVYEVPYQEVELEGYLIQTNLARSLEKILSQQAKAEQHSMLLSGQD